MVSLLLTALVPVSAMHLSSAYKPRSPSNFSAHSPAVQSATGCDQTLGPWIQPEATLSKYRVLHPQAGGTSFGRLVCHRRRRRENPSMLAFSVPPGYQRGRPPALLNCPDSLLNFPDWRSSLSPAPKVRTDPAFLSDASKLLPALQDTVQTERCRKAVPRRARLTSISSLRGKCHRFGSIASSDICASLPFEIACKFSSSSVGSFIKHC